MINQEKITNQNYNSKSFDSINNQKKYWPQTVSHNPELIISQVRDALVKEFPATTESKLRHLEKQGLLTPNRTVGGYRKYSFADVHRIKFILKMQRDMFFPLSKIKAQLDKMDNGQLNAGEIFALYSGNPNEITVDILAQKFSVDVDEIEFALEQIGFNIYEIRSTPNAGLKMIEAIIELQKSGLDQRHLKTIIRSIKNNSQTILEISKIINEPNKNIATMELKNPKNYREENAKKLTNSLIVLQNFLIKSLVQKGV